MKMGCYGICLFPYCVWIGFYSQVPDNVKYLAQHVAVYDTFGAVQEQQLYHQSRVQ